MNQDEEDASGPEHRADTSMSEKESTAKGREYNNYCNVVTLVDSFNVVCLLN